MNTVQKFIKNIMTTEPKTMVKLNPLKEQKMLNDVESLKQVKKYYDKVNRLEKFAKATLAEMKIENAFVKETGNKEQFTFEIHFVQKNSDGKSTTCFKIKKRKLVILITEFVLNDLRNYLSVFLVEMKVFFNKYNH